MELAAVGRDDFVQGFQLAGIRKTVVSTREELEKKIAETIEDVEVGILVLDMGDLQRLSHGMRRRLETVARPVVIAVGGIESEDLRTKIRRAIGVDLLK